MSVSFPQRFAWLAPFGVPAPLESPTDQTPRSSVSIAAPSDRSSQRAAVDGRFKKLAHRQDSSVSAAQVAQAGAHSQASATGVKK